MVMNEDVRTAKLMQNMLRNKLYVLLSKPRVPPEKLKAVLPAHLEYMIALEKRGLVFSSGHEARAIAEAEPFFVHGLRSFELKEWTVMEGTLGLRVNLSDQSVEVA